MTRVLDATPVADLDAHLAAGGGRGLETARNLAATDIIDLVAAAGLRGRGGAGFPTGTKWETVALYESRRCRRPWWSTPPRASPGRSRTGPSCGPTPTGCSRGRSSRPGPSTPPGSWWPPRRAFTDRDRPARGGDRRGRRGGLGARRARIEVVRGPSEYLFGEETALLEVVAGRPPVPPHRPAVPPGRRPTSATDPAFAAGADLASPGGDGPADPGQQRRDPGQRARHPGRGPRLVPLASAPTTHPGPRWCTITGSTRRHGVAEVADGHPAGRGHRRASAAAPARAGRSSPPCPAWPTRSCPPPPSTRPLGYDDVPGGRVRARRHRLHRLRRRRRPRRRGPRRHPLPRRRVLRPVPARASRTARSPPSSWSGSAARTPPTGTWPTSRTACSRSPTAPAASSPSRPSRWRARSSSSSPTPSRAHLDGSREAADAYLIAPIVDLVDGEAVLDETPVDQAARLDPRRDRLGPGPRRALRRRRRRTG